MQTALFILGMHRSGTSALTRVVNLLGADLSDNLMPPQPDNERGFWEQDEIVPAHEALLLSLRASWCDVAFLPEHFEKTDLAAPHAANLKSITKERFSGSSLWALKDPRLSILLPIWKPILSDLGVQPVYLIALRHPLEVAKSLEKRDAMPIEYGCALWLHYMLKSIQHTEGESRMIVSYDSLLKDWRMAAVNIASLMKREWPKSTDWASPQINTFLSADLRHHSAPQIKTDDSYFIKAALQLYDELVKFDGKDPDGTETIKTIANEFRQKTDTLKYGSLHANHRLQIIQGKLVAEEQKNHELRHQINTLTAEVESLKKDLPELREQIRMDEARMQSQFKTLKEKDALIARMTGSLSWRITAPLRTIKRLIFNR